MNIYGDYRICCKCKMKADVVERCKDFCADCWFKYFSGETLEQYEKRIKQLDDLKKDKKWNI